MIRSFAHDVIALQIDPASADVVEARRYAADDLYRAFRQKWEAKYRHMNSTFAAWAGAPDSRYDRGWTIGADVAWTDQTQRFREALRR